MFTMSKVLLNSFKFKNAGLFLQNRNFQTLLYQGKLLSHQHLTQLDSSKFLKHDGFGLQESFNHRSLSMDSFVAMQSRIFTCISEATATEYLKNYVIFIHDATGLPWWATVMLNTLILRTFIALPLAIYQSHIMAKLENISILEMPEIAKDIGKQTSLKAKEMRWSEIKAKLYYRNSLKLQWNKLIIRDNCHPLKATATIWFQLPTWIFFSAALRNMTYMLPVKTAEAQIIYLKLCVGGALWIPNLTQPDGLLVLPIILGLSNLAIIEIQAMMRMRKPSRLQRYATNFFRCFSVALVPISATVPSFLCLYWTTSSLLGLCQNLLIMSNKVRSFCGIPDTPTTLDHPYRQLIYEIRKKFSLTRKNE